MSALVLDSLSVGDVIQHARGKTAGENDVSSLSLLTLNSAEAHFNRDRMAQSSFGDRIAFGAINVAMIVGLAAGDTAEHAIEELGLNAVRLHHPVVEGDTLYAVSEVLEITADRPDSGVVRFRHWGYNQSRVPICSLERTVRLRRRP